MVGSPTSILTMVDPLDLVGLSAGAMGRGRGFGMTSMRVGERQVG